MVRPPGKKTLWRVGSKQERLPKGTSPDEIGTINPVWSRQIVGMLDSIALVCGGFKVEAKLARSWRLNHDS